jgi:hypothetical protein
MINVYSRNTGAGFAGFAEFEIIRILAWDLSVFQIHFLDLKIRVRIWFRDSLKEKVTAPKCDDLQIVQWLALKDFYAINSATVFTVQIFKNIKPGSLFHIDTGMPSGNTGISQHYVVSRAFPYRYLGSNLELFTGKMFCGTD